MRAERPGAVILACLLAATLMIGGVPAARGDETQDPRFDAAPPRLSLTDGQVSFWRPGAQDWTQAQVNTPLAPGDALSTGVPGTLEVQVGGRAFVRAWGNTQLSFGAQEPDFLQFTVAAGTVVFDIRALDPGDTVEVDTPNAVFSIQQAGYYRVDVSGEQSRVTTRRGGRATVTPAGGQAVIVTPSEELVIQGTTTAQLAAYAAPPLDDWDRWNYTRTERLLDAVSARYVAPGTYGVSDLDPYGTWRVVPTYGSVWVPTGVPAGWTPYSTGSWIQDPVYGWTWVDTAPWGWAPYHYGRWCFVDGYWAWAPGPVIAHAVYAPALVAFFGEPTAVVVGAPGPPVSWVALGWGEPVVPWWGSRGGTHGPSWRGWGGPRIVNNVVVNNTTVVNVQNINVYRNAAVPRAVVTVDRDRFGHGPVSARHIVQVDSQQLRPLPGAPDIPATSRSLTPTSVRGVRPAPEVLKRLEVAPERMRHEREAAQAGAPRAASMPPQHVAVAPANDNPPVAPLPRPSFGRGTTERPMTDRKATVAPPRVNGPGGPVPGHAGAPTTAERPLKTDGPKGPASPQVAGHPAAPVPPPMKASPGPLVAPAPSAPPVTHAPTGAVQTVAPVAPRPAPGKGPSIERQAPATFSPPGPVETVTKPKGGGSAPTVASPGHPVPAAHRPDAPHSAAPALPGEPANRLAPGRAKQDARGPAKQDPRGPAKPEPQKD
jgi:FecR protein